MIPTYRCAPYLPAAIESALHSSAAEILIADDASGLDVPRVAQRYEAMNPGRLRILFSRRRRGVSRNINDAVRHVRTPYFAKLDGDDVLIPGHLDAAFRLIAARPRLAIVAGHEQRIASEEMLTFRAESLPAFRPDSTPRVLSGTEAYRFILNWSPNPCSSGAIYRTEAFRAIGGFDSEMKWGEDWEIWLRFAQRWEVAYCDEPSALYRIHAESATARSSRQHTLCFGYDAVYRRAAAVCKDPEVGPMLRESFLRVAGLYAKAVPRHLLRFRKEALLCAYQAGRALVAAAGPQRVAVRHRVRKHRRLSIRFGWVAMIVAAVLLLGALAVYKDAVERSGDRPRMNLRQPREARGEIRAGRGAGTEWR